MPVWLSAMKDMGEDCRNKKITCEHTDLHNISMNEFKIVVDK